MAFLERLASRKRARFDALLRDFPGVSLAVAWRALDALRLAGLARRRLARTAANPRGFYWYYPTERGKNLTRFLGPYRDFWDLLQLKDLRALAGAERILESLDRQFKDFFPVGAPRRPRANYWGRVTVW